MGLGQSVVDLPHVLSVCLVSLLEDVWSMIFLFYYDGRLSTKRIASSFWRDRVMYASIDP